MNAKIRNFQDDNDIKSQVEIYNSIMKEFNPEAAEAKIEDVKKRYNNENWKPNQVNYLIGDSQDKIIGYVGFAYDQDFKTIWLGYPYIEKEFRSQELMQQLFDKHHTEAKKLNSTSMIAVYSTSLKPIHEFFDNQSYKTKYETLSMKIKTDKLNQTVPGYDILNFTKDRIKDVALFLEKNKDDAGPAFSEEILTENFDNGRIKPESHFIVEKEGDIKGIVGAGLPDRPPDPDDEDPVRAFLSFYAIEKGNSSLELRKALTVAIYPFLKANNIESYRTSVMEDSPSKPVCLDIGFKLNESEGNITYQF
ncbi:MAG: hypothetical protein ACXAC7_05345 [Candidatus Hodarchaeales archaeon]